MPKRILSIGNCGYDDGNITAALNRHFEVEVQSADTVADAVKAVGNGSFDLLLINRIFDGSGESGIDLIKSLNGTVKTPMMLISNYSESQQEAVSAGAVAGFGKTHIGSKSMIELVGKYLK